MYDEFCKIDLNRDLIKESSQSYKETYFLTAVELYILRLAEYIRYDKSNGCAEVV